MSTWKIILKHNFNTDSSKIDDIIFRYNYLCRKCYHSLEKLFNDWIVSIDTLLQRTDGDDSGGVTVLQNTSVPFKKRSHHDHTSDEKSSSCTSAAKRMKNIVRKDNELNIGTSVSNTLIYLPQYNLLDNY